MRDPYHEPHYEIGQLRNLAQKKDSLHLGSPNALDPVRNHQKFSNEEAYDFALEVLYSLRPKDFGHTDVHQQTLKSPSILDVYGIRVREQGWRERSWYVKFGLIDDPVKAGMPPLHFPSLHPFREDSMETNGGTLRR
jgi:hypothetical protein